MRKVDEIFVLLGKYTREGKSVTAQTISQELGLDRTNVSRYLNQLCKEKRAVKLGGRPVGYQSAGQPVVETKKSIGESRLDQIIGARESLSGVIQQAKAAMLYPPRGLHTLIFGETGVGKSMFAEAMHAFAQDAGMIAGQAPFVRFNCADYADNPQLLMAQIFGVKKGSYSGADADREGLLQQADKGVLFLDEVHRLPPQGQEMLFTFIDTGSFRALGSTVQQQASVQILAATTEDPHSSLLQTFTRRIPMTIALPALRQRSFAERYQLICAFLYEEARRLERDIYVERNAIQAFLLYDCPNNIGQLKSDIQLACAKAFLYLRASNQGYLLIHQEDLQARVKRGILNLQENREKIGEFLDSTDEVLVFSPAAPVPQPGVQSRPATGRDTLYFYDEIQQRMDHLREQGMSESEIHEVLNVDIEQHFRKYLRNLPEKFRREEILKVVPEHVVNLVEELLAIAEQELHREYDEKVYYGLALHLVKSFERIRYGSPIYHPQLNRIRKEYPEEFMLTIRLVRLIEQQEHLEIPFDEIGYITMFLLPLEERLQDGPQQRVQILVLMHGRATASSMAEAANVLAGGEAAHSLDMPLSMKVDEIYGQVRELLATLSLEQGLLLLVDMGSLKNFAAMLQEELKIPVKCLDMVSTPIVIEACRKALEGSNLDEIYRDCRDFGRYQLQPTGGQSSGKRFLIVTACFTGAGAAAYLRDYLQREILPQKVEIQTMEIIDRADFFCRLQELNHHYRLLAVVGTVNVPIEGIPFFSTADIFNGKGITRLKRILQDAMAYDRIRDSLQQHIPDVDVGEGIQRALDFLRRMQEKLHLRLSQEVQSGIVIHILFLLNRMIKGKTGSAFPDLEAYRAENPDAFAVAAGFVQPLEQQAGQPMAAAELGYLVRMCLQNNDSV